ncbi:MAG TPA: glycosyltransferase 87 family protein [Luteimicrobium sp.]|nr:glycosyltransferase 87 family protein [Luteimicrobium sp.]
MSEPASTESAGSAPTRAPSASDGARTALQVATGRTGVWVAFVVVHALLFWEASHHAQALFGDPGLYRQWAAGGVQDGVWPVLDISWVYPIGALVPVTLPALVSVDGEAYRYLFMVLVAVVDGLALGSLLHAGRGRTLGAWWWLVFLLFLGPITLVRLDGISAALTVIALAQLVPSPKNPDGRVSVASAFAAAGAWVKVAPGAVLVPLALTARRPWRRVVLPAVVVTAVVVGLAELGGAGSRVLGFWGTQDSRGLQVESGAATPFSLARLWSGEYRVFYNAPLNVLEITGPGTAWFAQALDVLLLAAVVLATVVTWRAAVRLRRDVPVDAERRTPQLELVLLSTLALTLVLFAFDKVGSPQYVAWFAPPVAVALTALRTPAWPGRRRANGPHQASADVWGVFALALLVVALLTHRLFPDHYDEFLGARPFDTVLEAVRNVLVLALAVGSLVLLGRHARRGMTGSSGSSGSRDVEYRESSADAS